MGGSPSKPDFERFPRPLAIGAGYPRTGTNSMQLALEKVYDGPCLHGGTHFLTREDAWGKLWCTALKAKRYGKREEALKAVQKGCEGYAALTDVPAVLLLGELLEVYPDLKFILVIRDSQKWWKSFKHVLDYADAWYIPVICSIIPGLRWAPAVVSESKMNADEAMVRLGKNPGEYGPELVEEYNESVRKLVPKDQLLEMRLSDGWEPLCRFLDRPIPNEPFPHVNESESATEVNARVMRQLLYTWAGIFSAIGLTAYGLGKLLWK